MSPGQPRLLFLTLSDDMGSERIVSEMGRRGALCAVMGRRHAIAARSVRVAHHVPLPSRGGLWMAALAVPGRLERAVADWRPDALVPLDDMAAQLLRDLTQRPRTGAGLRRLVEASLGDPAHYRVASCRALLIEAAAAAGVRVPAQRRAGSLPEAVAAAAAVGTPLMLKREGTCGGGGVTLVRDGAELERAFRIADRMSRAKRRARALIGFRPACDGSPLTLQAHVAGPLAMRTVACAAGRVLAGVSFSAECLHPPVTGSSTVVRAIDHPEMEAAARRMVEALGCSGFVSFDFILSGDGAAHLIEMNARPVGSGHLGSRFGHDVYGAWLRRFPGFRDADPPGTPAVQPAAVALFPKEMGRDPSSPHLATPDVLHDVPWDEPQVVAEYRARLVRRHPAEAAAIARRLGATTEGAPNPARTRFGTEPTGAQAGRVSVSAG